MALKKSELYSSLWSRCDELRGGIDASQYKDYVLVLLLIKCVSDKYTGVPYAPITIQGSAMCRRRNSKSGFVSNAVSRPWWPDSNYSVSGKPGAVQCGISSVSWSL